MALADWDGILLWLQAHGAPTWCQNLRRDELAALERERLEDPPPMPGRGGHVVRLRDSTAEKLAAFRQPTDRSWNEAVARLLDLTQGVRPHA